MLKLKSVNFRLNVTQRFRFKYFCLETYDVSDTQNKLLCLYICGNQPLAKSVNIRTALRF